MLYPGGMFEGFWGWPISQKVFGLLWLLAVAGCVLGLAVVLYLAS